MNAGTSFEKKLSSVKKLPGTKSTGQEVLASTGVSSFDSCIGGGMPVGSVLIVEDDERAVHSKLLIKYFIAEGLAFGHKIIACTSDTPTEILLKDIPTTAKKETNSATSVSQCSEPLKIAWRYQQLPPTTTSSQSRNYDWTRPISGEQLKNISMYNDTLTYSKVLEFIADAVKLQRTSAPGTGLLRVVVEGLGSPLWEDDDNASHFLFCLRALAREACCVVFLSSPRHWLQQDPGRRKQMRRLADIVVSLEVFPKREKQSHYNNYNGYIHFHRVNRPNTALHKTLSNRQDMAFFVKRKIFGIEKMHLPPALDQTPTIKVAPRNMCAVRPGTSLLEF